MKLKTHMVQKPWGRMDIPAEFGAPFGQKIGEIWYDDGSDTPLPLLVKWLFTSEKLSIQVHPNDAQAKARGQVSGKEECWYIVSAEPSSVLGIGTKRPLSADELRAASIDGSIEELMDWKPVQAGDYFYIPAGTVHAIGAGITLVEVQQYADITYRLYDYGRLDKGQQRTLHLDDGVAVSTAAPYCDARSGRAEAGLQMAHGPHFRLWHIEDETALNAAANDSPRWIVPLAGEAFCGEERAGVGDCLYVGGNATLGLTYGGKVLLAA
jgi:mannose-6-phosphate isomerase